MKNITKLRAIVLAGLMSTVFVPSQATAPYNPLIREISRNIAFIAATWMGCDAMNLMINSWISQCKDECGSEGFRLLTALFFVYKCAPFRR